MRRNDVSMRGKWCFSTLGCPELGVDDALSLAAEFGIGSIELRVLEGRLDMPGYFAEYASLNPKGFAALAGARVVALVGSSFGLVENTTEARSLLLKSARLADSLGARWVRVFGGFPFAEPLDDLKLRGALESLAWWEAAKAEGDIRCELLLELHDGFSSSSRCRSLLDAWGKPLGLLWDVEHSVCEAGETLAETWRRIGPDAVHVHVKDFVRCEDGSFKLALPGEGEFQASELFSLLRESSYGGLVSLEWEKHWQPELPSLREVLVAARGAGWLR